MEIQPGTINNRTGSKQEGMASARDMQQGISHILRVISSHMDKDNESVMLRKHN